MGEFDTLNFAEYSYSRKNEGSVLMKKVLVCILYAVFALVYFLVCYISRVVPIFALCPIFLWILIFFTWRYVSFDYFVEFRSGTLEIGTIKGSSKGRKKKILFSLRVQDLVYAARYTVGEEFYHTNKIHNFYSSLKSENLLAIIFENNGKREAVIFDCTTRIAGLIASYCPLAKELKGQKFIA